MVSANVFKYTTMKKIYYYAIISAIAIIIAIHVYAYTVDKQFGSPEQQMFDLMVAFVFMGIGMLYYLLIPIQKNNENNNYNS